MHALFICRIKDATHLCVMCVTGYVCHGCHLCCVVAYVVLQLHFEPSGDDEDDGTCLLGAGVMRGDARDVTGMDALGCAG